MKHESVLRCLTYFQFLRGCLFVRFFNHSEVKIVGAFEEKKKYSMTRRIDGRRVAYDRRPSAR